MNKRGFEIRIFIYLFILVSRYQRILPYNGHLDCFPFLSIMKISAPNILEQRLVLFNFSTHILSMFLDTTLYVYGLSCKK